MTLSAITSKQSTDDGQAALVDQAVSSVKWAILYNVVPRVVTPFSTMILAALLTPTDFGLVAVATFVTELARIVIELGLGKALIQREGEVKQAASVIFWVNLSTSLIMYFVLWNAAPMIGSAYKSQEIVSIVRVAILALPMTALMATPKALLRRKMQFNRLFWIYSSFLIIQAIIAVVLALMGFGARAVIWGQLIGMMISVVLSWVLVKWRPEIHFNWKILSSMLMFSIWVMISSFQEWAFTYADNAIAGLFLGVQGLGIYALGFNMATVLPGFLVAGLGDVAYATFCRMQNKVGEVASKLTYLQKLTATVLFPIAFGLSAVAPVFIQLLYGEKWTGLGTVISILVIMPGLSSLWTLNASAYQAIGRPDIYTKISGFSLVIMVPLLWIAASHGLLIFTITRFTVAWLVPLGNLLWGSRLLNINIRDQVNAIKSPFLMSGIMYLIVVGLISYFGPFEGLMGWTKFVTVILAGGAVYIIALRVITPDLWNVVLLNIKRAIFR